jgi:hypothetical protein
MLLEVTPGTGGAAFGVELHAESTVAASVMPTAPVTTPRVHLPMEV